MARPVAVADPGGLERQVRRLGLGVPGSDRLVGLVERRVVGVDHDSGEDAGDGAVQGRIETAPEQRSEDGLRFGNEHIQGPVGRVGGLHLEQPGADLWAIAVGHHEILPAATRAAVPVAVRRWASNDPSASMAFPPTATTTRVTAVRRPPPDKTSRPGWGYCSDQDAVRQTARHTEIRAAVGTSENRIGRDSATGRRLGSPRAG